MPGAWEILEERRKSILLCVIAPPELRHSRQWTGMWRRLALPTGSVTADIHGLPYDAARNAGIQKMLAAGCSWLAFLDSDVIPPDNGFLQLQATGLDLVGGLYHQRYPPFAPTAGMLLKEPLPDGSMKAPLPQHNPGEIVPVDVLGMGCTLISHRCIEAVMKEYERPFQWGYDLAPVYDSKGQIPRFSEDYIFCIRSKRLGFTPYVHTGVQCRHEFTAASTPQGVVPS